MNIQDLPLDRIIPYADNPRDNSGAVDAVAESIKQFGFNVPLVLDRDHVIITGHTRYKAAQKMGLSSVPWYHRGRLERIPGESIQAGG